MSEGEYIPVRATKTIGAGTFEVQDAEVQQVIFKPKSQKQGDIVYNEYRQGGSITTSNLY